LLKSERWHAGKIRVTALKFPEMERAPIGKVVLLWLIKRDEKWISRLRHPITMNATRVPNPFTFGGNVQ